MLQVKIFTAYDYPASPTLQGKINNWLKNQHGAIIKDIKISSTVADGRYPYLAALVEYEV